MHTTDTHVWMFSSSSTSMHVCLFVFLSIPDSWLANSDSFSLLIQSYIPTCMFVWVCMYIYVLFLFVFLSIPCSWWPNSLFLLDTGILLCPTTSCRPCQPKFLPGFHRLGQCVCFMWLGLGTEILCSSESVGVLSLLDLYLPVCLVLLVCVCVCLSVTMCTGRQTDTVERLAK
jgi:hypothetical protein